MSCCPQVKHWNLKPIYLDWDFYIIYKVFYEKDGVNRVEWGGITASHLTTAHAVLVYRGSLSVGKFFIVFKHWFVAPF